MKRLSLWLTAVVALLLSACSDETSRSRGVYMLLDTSGTYTKELDKAQQIINFVLAKLEPGDSFAVARIKTGSFSEKDIIARVTFDGQPSRANQQKRQFREEIDKFVAGVKPSAYTDITGGLLQSIEYLDEKNPGRKTVLIFSDMKEELAAGYVREAIPLQMQGYEVVALNVSKLRSDNIDPREYSDRLAYWRQRIEAGGGSWRVLNDLERLEALFLD
jgi:hypothetical protein